MKGFTIIELIVVIAIISILATIVSANVIQYISKAQDSAIKAQLEQIRTVATDYISTSTSGYNNLCIVDTQCYKLEYNINNLGGKFDSNKFVFNSYCISYKLNAVDKDGVNKVKWCIDSTGYSGPSSNCSSYPYSCTGS